MQLRTLFCTFALLISFCFASSPEEFQLHFYDGIPGCQCFLHCTCYSTSLRKTVTYKPSCSHRDEPQNSLWHNFIEGTWDMHRYTKYSSGDSRYPYSPCGNLEKLLEIFHSREAHDCCLLSNYLNNLQNFSRIVDETRDHSLFIHSIWQEEGGHGSIDSPRVIQEAKKLQSKIVDFRAKVIGEYETIQACCSHFDHPQNLAYIYNQGLLSMVYGDMYQSVENIKKFIKFCKEHGRVELLTSNVYQGKGDAYFAVGMYNKAIKALTKAIEKDPANKSAYFSRALAYFESGNFERALEDYLASDRSKSVSNVQLLTSLEFHNALLKGVYEGAKESTEDFFPSLYHSVCGLGEAVWIFTKHPADSTKHFANACYDLSDNIYRNIKALAVLDKQKLDSIVIELKQLYERFDQLSDAEKGELIGKAIGKYGIDIFVTRGIGKGARGLKSLSVARKAKEANALCNLEAMAVSQSNKEIMAQKIAERQAQKAAIRKELKIEVDKQNKHIAGKHNFDPALPRSVWEHPDPQGLVNKFSGKGRPLNKATPGSAGYKEKVNCGEFVGYHVSEKTLEKTPTTWATIHYSKTGVHIVPAMPD